MSNEIIRYEVNGAPVELSNDIIRKYLVNGQGNVTDQECKMFLEMCRSAGLNPFLKDAYLIKYGAQQAQMITGIGVFERRAFNNEKYRGMEDGVIVVDKDGLVVERTGSFTLSTDTIVGGWGRVYVKDYAVPITATVSFDEYCSKKDGKPSSTWAKMPGVMINKVAKVAALRKAFPDDLRGLYETIEMNVDETIIPEQSLNSEQIKQLKSIDVVEAKITKAQVNEIFKKANGNVELIKDVLNAYGLETGKDIPKSLYDAIINDIDSAIENQQSAQYLEVVEDSEAA